MQLPDVLNRLLVWLDARRVRERGDPEHHQLAQFFSPGQVALDVGANHGVYTYSLMLCGGRVHAIEPNPMLAARLRGAHLRGVTVHEAAVGDVAGEAVLFVPRHRKGRQDDPAGRLAEAGDGGEGWRYSVKVITIDGLGLGPIAFIKMDVEGYETLAVTGGWATVLRDRPHVLIELEERREPGCRRGVIGRFTDVGYSAWYLDQGDWRDETLLGVDQTAEHGRYINNFLLSPTLGKPAMATPLPQRH